MIISCIKCNKNFEVKSDLIPEKGRLLQCSSCNHKWFYQKIVQPPDAPSIVDDKNSIEKNLNKDIQHEQSSSNLNDITPDEESITITTDIDTNIYNNNQTKIQKKNSFKILNLILVFIISAIAFIIFLDTFKPIISIIIPDIEFILYNLYESVKDIFLFFKDLM